MNSLSRNRQSGIGLIELMISITLGLFLLSGAIGVLVSTKSSYSMNNDLTWIQDNARFASATVNRDLRMAGFYGCSSDQGLNSTINSVGSGTGWYTEFNRPVLGWDGEASNYPDTEFPTAFNSNAAVDLPSSDLVTIRRTDDSQYRVVDNVPLASATITIVGTHDLVNGDIVAISDCEQTSIVQKRGNSASTIEHAAGAGSPGNCTDQLKAVTDCDTSSATDYYFYGDKGAFASKMLAHAYYVSTGADGSPTLYRRELQASGGVATLVDEELVQGVENVQVVYGLDTNNDGYANRYLNADEVPATDWPAVVTVRLHMLMRSFSAVASEPQSFRFFDSNYTPTDRFLRQEFVSTIELRNRG